MTAPLDSLASRAPSDRPAPHQAAKLERARAPLAETPPIVAVTGGKGGVGKTVVAVNLAILAQQAGYRVLLADLDPGLGNVDVHLRVAPRFTVEDLAEGRCTTSEALTAGPAGIRVLGAQPASARIAQPDTGLLDRIHDAVARAAREGGFDLVIVDTGAGIGAPVIEAIRRADEVLSITTPDPAAITDAYALCKVVHLAGLTLPRIVLNRGRSHDAAQRTIGRLAVICEQFLGARPEIAGCLRVADAVERAVCEQRPVALDDGTTPILDDLRALSAGVLSRTVAHRGVRTAQRNNARRLFVRPVSTSASRASVSADAC